MTNRRFRNSFAVVAAAALATLALAGAQGAAPATAQQVDSPAAAPQAFASKAEADAVTKANLQAQRGRARVASAPGQCTGPWVWLTDTVGVFNHASPDRNDIKYWLAGGEYIACRKLVLGDRYDGCGSTGANGYILIPDIRAGVSHAPLAGLVISACTED
ncbi:hypothetical protein [Amycolatopsis sp. lyj-23]|uniref:hypothetical protein n=1 Tax=Amycolatopsis sp. lyj-23 TaxID=2789283 RepID=UPI003979FB37